MCDTITIPVTSVLPFHRGHFVSLFTCIETWKCPLWSEGTFSGGWLCIVANIYGLIFINEIYLNIFIVCKMCVLFFNFKMLKMQKEKNTFCTMSKCSHVFMMCHRFIYILLSELAFFHIVSVSMINMIYYFQSTSVWFLIHRLLLLLILIYRMTYLKLISQFIQYILL